MLKNKGNTKKKISSKIKPIACFVYPGKKSMISFSAPSHHRLIISGFENHTFLRLILARGELVQNVYRRNVEKMENKKVGN